MKFINIYNKIKALCLVAIPLVGIGGGTLTSCDKFLSIQPTNEIVLENYWTEEADVYSVLNACYSGLESSKCIERMIVWGEARSENMVTGANTPNDLQQVFKENILETSTYSNWQCFYEVINLCNTVIHYAPMVESIDPNFTEAELNATIAEATTIRSLCYFYLIRAFRDVPYVTEPSLDDTQNYIVPATPFAEVLDHIINDVENVKDNAVRSYGEKSIENTCRITRWACYALLADMYLWKGDWDKVIENCDLIIDHKIKEYEYDYERNPTTLTTELYGKFPLISESTSSNENYAGNAYSEIFGEGNSFESIFELIFVRNSGATNNTVSSFYGSSQSRTGQIGAYSYLYSNAYLGTNDYFAKTDCRYIENMTETNNKVYISKYVNQSVSFRTNSSGNTAPSVTTVTRSSSTANWIIYRLTDVMLMRAEAEVMLAGNNVGEQITEDQDRHFRKAFECISAVWKRANNKRIASSDTLEYSTYAKNLNVMEDLVLDERQRELMFEGKRWFDLVRVSLRHNDNERLITKILPKFNENTTSIRVKLSTQDILFWPYARKELEQNTELKQNPAYKTDNTIRN